VPVTILLRHENIHVPPDYLVRPVSEDPLGRRVEETDPSVLVDRDDPLRDVLNDRLEMFFTVPEFQDRPFARGDVAEHDKIGRSAAEGDLRAQPLDPLLLSQGSPHDIFAEKTSLAFLDEDKVPEGRFEIVRMNEFRGVASQTVLGPRQIHKTGRGLVRKEDRSIPVQDQDGVEDAVDDGTEEFLGPAEGLLALRPGLLRVGEMPTQLIEFFGQRFLRFLPVLHGVLGIRSAPEHRDLGRRSAAVRNVQEKTAAGKRGTSGFAGGGAAERDDGRRGTRSRPEAVYRNLKRRRRRASRPPRSLDRA